jgi:hypothetical protein
MRGLVAIVGLVSVTLDLRSGILIDILRSELEDYGTAQHCEGRRGDFNDAFAKSQRRCGSHANLVDQAVFSR